MIPVLTIDGPSGSGKGTLALTLSRELGFHLLDSGAIYRLAAFKALKEGLVLENSSALLALLVNLDIRFEPGSDGVNTWLDGEAVGAELRTEATGNAASTIAAIPEVRAALLQRQRDFCQAPGLVADGRDMGSVVFPDALHKIFLTASPEIRAERRYKQLKSKGLEANMRALLEDIQQRDERDQQRSVAPLKPAEGALVLDSTLLTVPELTAMVLDFIQQN